MVAAKRSKSIFDTRVYIHGKASFLHKETKEQPFLVDSLIGLVPSDIDEDAIKTERLSRQ